MNYRKNCHMAIAFETKREFQKEHIVKDVVNPCWLVMDVSDEHFSNVTFIFMQQQWQQINLNKKQAALGWLVSRLFLDAKMGWLKKMVSLCSWKYGIRGRFQKGSLSSFLSYIVPKSVYRRMFHEQTLPKYSVQTYFFS